MMAEGVPHNMTVPSTTTTLDQDAKKIDQDHDEVNDCKDAKRKECSPEKLACGCQCATDHGDRLSLDHYSAEQGNVSCNCTACGPWDETQQMRRCLVQVSPMKGLFRFVQNYQSCDDPGDTAFCGDCSGYCLLQIHKAAVQSSRAKRIRSLDKTVSSMD